jgi:hypothetical protein
MAAPVCRQRNPAAAGLSALTQAGRGFAQAQGYALASDLDHRRVRADRHQLHALRAVAHGEAAGRAAIDQQQGAGSEHALQRHGLGPGATS